MSRTGQEVRVRRYPVGAVMAEDFEIVRVPVADPGPGQVLVRNTWTSVDPGLRLRLRPDAPAGYFAAFPLGRAMDGVMAVGEVVESRAAGFSPGDLVSHAQGWRDFAVVDPRAEQLGGIGNLTRLDAAAEPKWYLGALGGMGLTAYAGLQVIGALRGDETVWVSAAAGAVGSLAVQIAKLRGNRVIASAGTDHKVAWLRDALGVTAFNYRIDDLRATLRKLAPGGIDAYFDSVGGDHLEAALDHLRRRGRVAMCGSISEYESEPRGPRNLFMTVSKDLTLRGFRGSSHLDLLPEMRAQMSAWLRSGELVHRDTVFDGLDQAPRALSEMLAGRTTGKTLVSIG